MSGAGDGLVVTCVEDLECHYRSWVDLLDLGQAAVDEAVLVVLCPEMVWRATPHGRG